MIESNLEYTEKNAETNKWDVLLDLQRKIAETANKVAFYSSKLHTGSPVLGDACAEFAAAERKLSELKDMYSKILTHP